ncbi:hypothetical protein HK104_001278 [Borealophlyctis nickersoniae]|nr:hypothetical protein HK104_001278 [Borealophlyctis nickersoniae]
MSKEETYEAGSGGDVVKDEDFERLVEHGDDPYDPAQEGPDSVREASFPTRKDPYPLRDSTLATRDAGIYAEDESGLNKPLEELAEPEGDIDTGVDTEKRFQGYMAQSHRRGRSPEGKRKSAEKASELYEKMTGHPLEINEQGEVVVEKP